MNLLQNSLKRIIVLATFILIGVTACQLTTTHTQVPVDGSFQVASPTPVTATQTLIRTPDPESIQTPTFETTLNPVRAQVSTPTSTPAPVFYEPAGCWQPPDDYSRIMINDQTLSARTYAMLKQAALLYGGEIDVAGNAIIRGSYSDISIDQGDSHQGGGAVDLSVTHSNSNSILYMEIEPLIRALRTVGFAAWFRENEEIGSEPAPHIHAIAIGDRDLSPAAREELTGAAGYLRGFDGLSISNGEPKLDQHGGPLICHWILEAGYADLRTPTIKQTPDLPWQERLRQVALSYQAFYPEDAEKVARSLHFLDGKSESAENICGPLAGAILRDAGLLPNQQGPVQELLSYWQARPSGNGRPWSLFPERDYEVFRFATPLAEFDFNAWPLQPADFVYAYTRDHGFEHMFIVTEVDADGRAYTVTNQTQIWGNPLWGTMLILRYMLYDPHAPGEGIIYNEWSNGRLGVVGNNGFEVMRKRGLEAGSLYTYTVRPGDTLPDLAERFGANLESITQANPGSDLSKLQVGQPLAIPIPTYVPVSP